MVYYTRWKRSNKLSENCYNYLTELVRNSNFPLSEWKIDKNKVDLLIDEENVNTISCKFFLILMEQALLDKISQKKMVNYIILLRILTSLSGRNRSQTTKILCNSRILLP